jgi:hypothetical protein
MGFMVNTGWCTEECACATNLNDENTKFACFNVVLCFAGWFNLDLVDV